MKKYQQGFTLIETVVYLALFAIFIGGAVVTAYSMFEASGRSQTKSLLQEEGDFLKAKIEWALTGARTVDQPQPGSPLSTLQVTKYDGSSVTINLAGSDVQLQSTSLNNSRVKATSLLFTQTSSSGGGLNPISLQADFTLTASTPNGVAVSQNFSSTKYLRK